MATLHKRHQARGLTRRETVGLLLLGLLVVATALGMVYSRHQSRQLFIELRALQQRHDGLQEEWGRLLLEQTTWATHNRVEREAGERLGMEAPAPEAVVVVRL